MAARKKRDGLAPTPRRRTAALAFDALSVEGGLLSPDWLAKVEPADFALEAYQHHAPLTAPMAV